MAKTLCSIIISYNYFYMNGGYTPFWGFLPKLIKMYCLIINNMVFPCFTVVVSPLLVMFFYLCVVFTSLMINSLSMKLKIDMFPWKYYIFGMISLFGMSLIFFLCL